MAVPTIIRRAAQALDAPVSFATVFNWQSYFSSTRYEKALSLNPGNSALVSSTKQSKAVRGYSVGLSADSQCPVVVSAKAGSGGGAATPPFLLTPGQVVTPLGPGEPFTAIEFGLPTGWLGGGLARLVVTQSPEAKLAWNAPASDIPFHRLRLPISNALEALRIDWPCRFPWQNAVYNDGTNNVALAGKPLLQVQPTRLLMRLRVNNLATANEIRLVGRGLTDFDEDNAGVVGTTDESYTDITFPMNAGVVEGFPVIEVTDWPARVGSESGGISLLDITGGLNTKLVDIVRYGRLV